MTLNLCLTRPPNFLVAALFCMDMSPDAVTHTFTARIECLYPGTKWFGVFAPWDMHERHGSKRIRAVGEFVAAGGQVYPFELAFQNMKGRGYYIYVSQAIQKQLGVALGDTLTIRYQVDDPERVDVPEELVHALALDAEAEAVFAQLKAGRKRGISVYIRSVKDTEKRIQKALEVAEGLRQNGLHGWPAKGGWDQTENRRRSR